MIARIVIALFLLLFSSSIGWSASSITNVTGTVATGQTLTITGTNMVYEDLTANGKVLGQSASYHNGASPSADGFTDNSSDGYWSTTNLIGTSGKSIRFHANYAECSSDGACGAPGHHCFANTYFAFSGIVNAWYRVYVKYDQAALDAISSPDTGHWKFFIGGDWGGVATYIQPVQGTLNRWYVTGDSQVTLPSNMVADRWYALEFNINSTTDVVTMYWDGVSVGTGSIAGAGSSTLWQWGIINACINMPAGDRYLYTDGMNVGSSRLYPLTTIEISNNSTYGAGTKVFQQVLDNITDTSIQIKADLTGLGAGPYYMWVTNSRQERSLAYSLSGGGGDSTPPIVDTFGLPATSTSLIVSFDTPLTAHDDVAVTNYCVNESSTPPTGGSCSGTGWLASAPTSYTFSTAGDKTLYAWAKDASGNVSSSLNDTVTITLPSQTIFLTEHFDDNASGLTSRGWFDGASAVTCFDATVYYGGSGKSLKWTWASSATVPTNMDTMRYNLTTPTDKLYVSFYWRFNSDWVGSGVDYHPHIIYVSSDADNSTFGNYPPLSWNILQTYIETGDIASPFIGLTPKMGNQDGYNIAYNSGGPIANYADTSENRDVNGCNGAITGQDVSNVNNNCYNSGVSFGAYTPPNKDGYAGNAYWNGRQWNGTINFTKDTWYFVEAYFQMNTISGSKGNADGIMWMKINGTYVINSTTVLYRTNQHSALKWKQFVIAPYFGDGSPQIQTMWMDELIIGDGQGGYPPIISGPLPIGFQRCTASPLPTTLQVTTDSNSTCKYTNISGDVSYADMAYTFSTTGGITHQQSITVGCGFSYNYWVRCSSGGNIDTSSTLISFSVDKLTLFRR